MKSNSEYAICRFAMMLALSGVVPVAALAAVTDLANGPLANGIVGNTVVKPNIAFVVDDSGSMNDENMPDDNGTNDDKSCWGWYKYNTLFYNPGHTYKPPFKLDGTVYSDGVRRFPDASFTAALKDGYFPLNGYTYGGSSTSNTAVSLATTSNLTTSASTKYYYSYPSSSSNNASTTCLSDDSYTKVTSAANIAAPNVAIGSDAAKTNYANWYSYYRKRSYLMKAASGEAFKDLDESQYRVGIFFLNSVESGAANSTRANSDLKIADYAGTAAGTQRYIWYSKLYGGRSGGWTPNRGALSRMGRMYAGQISDWDPVQYSCQQNFTILSTDGYWNTPGETSSYGPKQIDGTTNVGNTDGGAASAVGSTATITIGGSDSSGCYKFTSVTVNPGTGDIQLMNTPASAPTNCTKDRNQLGEALRDSIKAKTGTTGFDATYNNGVVTIAASPTLYPSLSAPPVATAVKVSGNKSRTFNTTAFGGYVAATNGAELPYKDALNIQDTLGDIAYYYYTTDLRDLTRNNCTNPAGSATPTHANLCDNNVRGNGKDTNNQQHMTTFTIGLGVSGTIKYESNYETAPNISGVTQYVDIKNGTTNWPNPNTDITKIDDLWHAAVNGRGTYYSATDSNTLKDGIQSALAGISARRGSSAAAATSNLEPVAGDNFVYVALYQTVAWDGDLKAFAIDPDTGALSGAPLWSAQAQLDAQVTAAEGAPTPTDGRTIKYFSAGVTNKLKDFTLANLSADALDSNFSNICNKTPAIAQCSASANPPLDATQLTAANNADNLIKYLRGRTQHEDEVNNATVANRIYRGRDHILGDIVNAVPVYMKKPPFTYDKYDSTYATFKTDNANRAPTVFIAANDGMLHAINANNDDATNKGKERWAFVPTLVMPNMWNLADRNYANNHRFFVDGSPTIADVCTSLDTNAQMCAAASNWKTILVGGLNKGGCGYYALDVTDPTSPKGLWEFTNANLGYSYGNPVIAKRKNGQWVVIVTSGYNNYPGNGCGNTGDGNGHVFVLDAATGALLEDIPTNTGPGTSAGSTATPSGLGKLNSWIVDQALPVADRLYAGDMLGNVWRIDFDDNYAPTGKEAVRLAQLKDSSSNPQPITVKPELAELTYNGQRYAVVMASTGRYIGLSDVSDISQQSIYGLKDSLISTGIGNVRGASMKARTLAETSGSAGGALAGRTIRTVSGSTVNWTTDDGWYLDLNPLNRSPGERVNVDMSLQFNTLTVAANVPSTNSCDAGGYAFLYFLNINNGKNMASAVDGMAGVRLSGNALVAGIRTVRVASGTKTIVTDTTGNVTSEDGGGDEEVAGAVRRTMWREIPD